MKSWPVRKIRGKKELPCTMVVMELDAADRLIGYGVCGERAKVIVRDEALCVRCADAHWMDTARVQACERWYGEPHG